MSKNGKEPDYVFEISWEVCNKVGGIYTVLSTQAKALNAIYADNLIYVGPDFNEESDNFFIEDKSLLNNWVNQARKDNLYIRVGRWNIPGSPVVVLVKHRAFANDTNAFLFELWDHFGIDSLKGYGDYGESVLFGYATAKVVEHYYDFFKLKGKKVVAQFHEWTSGSGLLYTTLHDKDIRTLFTTHATTAGRSICFNGKNLYQYFKGYNGDQMADELNVKAKHQIEKCAAQKADCFTTVSELTGIECEQLLEKKPDIITPNGFEDNFVPSGANYTKARKDAKATLRKVAETLFGYKLPDNTLFVATSGRYEYRNKGIDMFLTSLHKIQENQTIDREIVAFLLVPGWNVGARKDLQNKLNDPTATFANYKKYITHWIYNYNDDNILHALRTYHFENNQDQKVKVILVPCYLKGNDGIFNKSYYDLLVGFDLTVFASYYEPWGYTPLESAAFGIPTITTDLAGFGLWVSKEPVDVTNGVAVLHRNDTNYDEAAENIKRNIEIVAGMDSKTFEKTKKKASDIAKKCSWNDFIKYYQKAFEIALSK